MKDPATEKPCIGVPYRTRNEELNHVRAKLDNYLRFIESAGGVPVEISLDLSPDALRSLANSLDGFVLPGSPADVDPSRFHAPRHQQAADPDPARERTDIALLEHAFAEGKPALAICYGIQILNVFLDGLLIQDIPSELHTTIRHEWAGKNEGQPEPFHEVTLSPDSRLAKLAAATEVRVNSSHHQSIREPGRDLRVVGKAPDGVVEAVEWTGGPNWVTGVQWHPERMTQDPLAKSLFRDLIAAARGAAVRG